MAKYRQNRINEEMAKELCEILRTVKDPRVSGAIVSITAVDCTPDLKFAKIYFSAVGQDAEALSVKKGLDSAVGYIRGQLAARLNLRITPELRFYHDCSIEHGAHINELLKSVEADLKDD